MNTKQDWKRERKGRELRIEWREYKEQSKRVGKQRESKERENRESAVIDREWGQREQKKLLVEFFFVFLLDFFIYFPVQWTA